MKSILPTLGVLQGLDFSIHADGAWGGYFCSMLRDQPATHHLRAPEDSGFVPQMYLSSYVHDQLAALDQCDTITIDPHKSGFCPYPAGALCYKDKQMNTFLQITTSVVYYHGDMTLGDIGIEGSKPGAAAASVMLANRVTVSLSALSFRYILLSVSSMYSVTRSCNSGIEKFLRPSLCK